jgi:hypothetical protein
MGFFGFKSRKQKLQEEWAKEEADFQKRKKASNLQREKEKASRKKITSDSIAPSALVDSARKGIVEGASRSSSVTRNDGVADNNNILLNSILINSMINNVDEKKHNCNSPVVPVSDPGVSEPSTPHTHSDSSHHSSSHHSCSTSHSCSSSSSCSSGSSCGGGGGGGD